MAEAGIGESQQTRAVQISEAAKSYKDTPGGEAREKIVNTSLVVRNELGIANPASFNAVRDIALDQIKEGTYMPDVVTELNEDNLVGIGNAFFYREGPRQTLEDVAARISRLAESERPTTTSPREGEFREDIFREMAERIRDNTEDSRKMLESISTNATPEFVEEVLMHQPELLGALIINAEAIDNDVLRDIILRRAEKVDAEGDLTTRSPEPTNPSPEEKEE